VGQHERVEGMKIRRVNDRAMTGPAVIILSGMKSEFENGRRGGSHGGGTLQVAGSKGRGCRKLSR